MPRRTLLCMRASRRLGALLAVAALVMVVVPSSPGSAVDAPCVPDIPLVDPMATPAAQCVAAQLDTWKRDGVMGVGQQLDIARRHRADSPLKALQPLRPAVVGFDLGEILYAEKFYGDDPIPYLIRLARSGIILTAGWHPDNPITRGQYDDRGWTDVVELLDPASEASKRFWRQYERALVDFRRLQDAGVALIFKPFHEAAGGWFWWGKPRPVVYKRLFAEMQRRTYESGVHNVLWAYSAAQQNWPGVNDPIDLIPPNIDLVGLDVYDDEVRDPVDRLPLQDYRLLSARAPRMALTEVGPAGSLSGDWNPRVVTDTLRARGLYASFAMLWRDEPDGPLMQISSLTGGPRWLASCPSGLCRLGPP